MLCEIRDYGYSIKKPQFTDNNRHSQTFWLRLEELRYYNNCKLFIRVTVVV